MTQRDEAERVHRAATAPSWTRLVLAGLLMACAAHLVGGRMRSVTTADQDRKAYFGAPSADRGESLIYGLPPSPSEVMPLLSIVDAWLRGHVPPRAAAAVIRWSFCACAVLTFGLGCLLHSGLCGAVAVILFAWAVPSALFRDRWLFALTFMLIAYLAAWRARAPRRARSLALAGAVGCNLLTLSAMCLLPVVMAVREWADPTADGDARGRRRLAAGALLLLPLLFLAPWAVMNWRMHHRVILIEDGRADCNIVAGALGLVQTINCGHAFSPSDGASLFKESPILWAAGEVLAHPLRYLWGCLQRFFYIFSLYPALFALGAAALWINRRRQEYRWLAVLAATYVGIHGLMSVEGRYIWPLIPLLSVLAAGALTGWLEPDRPRWGAALSAGLAGVFLAPVLAAGAWALGLVAIYPGRASRPDGLERELRRHGDSGWLWDRHGRELLQKGRFREAADSFAKALARGHRPESPHEYVMAMGPAAEHLLDLRTDTAFLSDFAKILLALQREDGRRAREMSERFIATVDSLHGGVLHDGSSGLLRPEPEMGARVLSTARGREARVAELIRYWPEPALSDLLPRLKALLDAHPRLASRLDQGEIGGSCVDRAAASVRSGARRDALRELKAAGDWPLDAERAASKERLLAELGRKAGPPAPAPRPVAAPRPAPPLPRRPPAPERPEPRTMTAEQQRRLGLVRAFLERPEQGLEPPAEMEPGLLLDLAEEASRAGRRDLALECLRRARRSPLDGDQLGRSALVLQALSQNEAALEALDLAVARLPQKARWLADRGVLQAMLGRSDAAAADLKAAIAREPDFLPPYLSLGSLYASLGRREEAEEVYRQALSRKGRTDEQDRSIRRLIEAERAPRPGPVR